MMLGIYPESTRVRIYPVDKQDVNSVKVTLVLVTWE